MNGQELTKLDYFQIFGLAQDFQVDTQNLKLAMCELQKKFHPDNFVNRESMVQSQALQVSSLINTAFNILISPLDRGIYLLKLNGIELDLAHNTKFAPEFLMEQMELHESIAEAKNSHDINQLENIEINLKQQQKLLIKNLEANFGQSNMLEAAENIKRLAFYNKLVNLLDNILSEV